MESRETIEIKDMAKNEDIVEKKNILKKDLNLKETLIVIGILALIIGYARVFIYPIYKDFRSSVSELEQVQQQIVNHESEISNLPNLEKQLASLNSEMRVQRKTLSHNMEDGMFLVGLSNLINRLDIDLVSYTMDETIPYSSFYAIPTTIEIRGDYNNIREVMNYLEEQKNTTQILDYNMETYIEEIESKTTQDAQIQTQVVNNPVVYWTEGGNMFHKKECSILNLEYNRNLDEISYGSAEQSGKNLACEVCKPYTISSEESQQIQNIEPIATGDIVAKFKFIMYSTENPKYGLGIEDNSNWQPGKYNPFTTTTR